jgi:hypothetical protein
MHNTLGSVASGDRSIKAVVRLLVESGSTTTLAFKTGAQPDVSRRDWTMPIHSCSYDGLRSDTCTGTAAPQWLRQRRRG